MSILILPLNLDHQELAKRVKEYLKENKEVDLRVFIGKEIQDRPSHDIVNKVADELRALGKYSFSPVGLGDTNTFIVSRKSWRDRNPILSELRTALFTALFALGVGWLLNRQESQDQAELDNRQDGQLQRLSDSLHTIEKLLGDSLPFWEKSAETGLKNKP